MPLSLTKSQANVGGDIRFTLAASLVVDPTGEAALLSAIDTYGLVDMDDLFKRIPPTSGSVNTLVNSIGVTWS